MSLRPLFDLKELAATASLLIAAMAYAIAFVPPPQHRVLAMKPVVHAAKAVVMVKTLVAAPPVVPLRPRTIAVRVSKPSLPADAVAAVPLPPQPIAPDPAMIAEQASRVAAHLSDKVPAALAPYFDTFIYVSKAASGPWAQHLFLFRKADDGTLTFEQSFPVSTGREQSEQYFTATPTGLFELDVHRFFPMARSAKWNDAQMPWAMFLNYAYRTQMSGVALHAAIGRHELADIGHRASGGCVRLPLEKANLLYHRFLAEERGQVPVFAFDSARGTTNTDGITARDEKGDVVLTDGLRVLVVIDNLPGLPAAPPQS
ncbi:MAG TPA: L,D-transpeptidase family protein [Rhizomicrobium sp.]|nr:L,D-transpeptidase family protein [Rhizomicrobium sp.]